MKKKLVFGEEKQKQIPPLRCGMTTKEQTTTTATALQRQPQLQTKKTTATE
ncbi:hypothetical protein RBB79_04095 [Tunturiibacter empetritectus]|uniref:Uncharacterized protein n=1 Tax=Tunturiibacter lichenicola TaxID=2051959 RepID=A0A852VGV0_9BACT|nr:hypothetical protein [Edaphobacter lichenicola]NYF88696.1 hypothetical protein [Edaphobacter lichenicola]